MDSKTVIEAQLRLSELKTRAIRAGYKCVIPKIPRFKKEKPEVHESQMMGFRKRLHNWEQGLLIFENPGGIPQPNKEATTVISDGVNLIKEQ